MATATATTVMTTTIDDIHPDILARAFRRMDGQTLAASGCSSSLFRALSADPSIWRDLCLSAWPSLRLLPMFPLLCPRSFFADSFPFPDTDTDTASSSTTRIAHVSCALGIGIGIGSGNGNSSNNMLSRLSERKLPESLFSCVDIYHAGVPVFSRVIETDTSCPWFLGSVFRIDALDRKDPPVPEKLPIAPAELELSWVMVDAGTGRAVNVSSRKPVEVGRHWYTGEALVRFVTVLDGCAVSIVVTCGVEAGQMRDVSMTVEDWDGIAVHGKETLGILAAATKGGRRGRWKKDDAKRRYEEYLRNKTLRKERKARREGMLDLCCTGFGAMVFLAFLMLIACKR